MFIRDRRQMAQLLDERMNRTYTALSERQDLEVDTSLVKTYLLEAHLSEEARPEDASTLAEYVVANSLLGRSRRTRTERADDPELLTIQTQLDDERIFLYFDFTNPRYWLLHSMGSSTTLDRAISGLVTAGPELDHAWFPADLLERASKLGDFRGLNLDYDRRVVPDVDFSAPDAPVEFLKMQLWGNKAAEVLRILRKDGAFPHETTLAKVKVKHWLQQEFEDAFALDDIKYDGKVTARGTSFQSHIALVSSVYYRLYASQIRLLEHRYALRKVEEDALTRLTGEPIHFEFGRPVSSLERFCDSIFSSTEPFRLWGVPVRLSSSYYRVQAVDLHVGGLLTFEITPQFMRVYLPVGSCGNTILRLYTNLQHHYDSLVQALDGNGRPVFEF